MAKGISGGGKLYAHIAQEVRTMIEEGMFRPGQKLPPLADLATRFGCSRATVREALGTLRGQGLVELRHGDGTYVKSASVDVWMEPLDAAILLGTNQVEQLVDFLTAVLTSIVSYAANHHEEMDATPLKQTLFLLECADPADEEAIAAELAFYLQLATHSNNILMENALRVLQEALRSCLRVVKHANQTGVKTCREVLDAVLVGDGDCAREVVHQHGIMMMDMIREHRNRRPSNMGSLPTA